MNVEELESRSGGFSFPSTGGRLLLGPDPSEVAGMGGVGTSLEQDEPLGGGTEAANAGPLESRPNFNDPGASADGAAGGGAVGSGAVGRPAPADPNQAAGAGGSGGGTAAQQAQWTSIRDAAKALGYNFEPTITDDRSALAHLIRQATASQQSNYYADLGRQIVPHAQQFQSYLQQQQPAQPQQRPAWEAPPFDDRWLALVNQDPATGVYVAKPGVDPAIARQVNEFVEWKTGYDRNPAAVLNQMVEAKAREIAQQVSREQLAQSQQQATIQQIAQANASWLYQKDEQGRLLVGANGTYLPSPEGARYMDHLRALSTSGIKDPRVQDNLARQLLAGEIALSRLQAAGAAQGQAASPQTQQAIHQPNVNPLQALPPSQRRRNPAATEPAATGLSLSEMLRQDMAAEGISDGDIFNSVGQ